MSGSQQVVRNNSRATGLSIPCLCCRHRITLRSSDADARTSPSGDHLTALTLPVQTNSACMTACESQWYVHVCSSVVMSSPRCTMQATHLDVVSVCTRVEVHDRWTQSPSLAAKQVSRFEWWYLSGRSPGTVVRSVVMAPRPYS